MLLTCIDASAAPAPKPQPCTITVDAATIVNSFRPADMFGVNVVPYVDRSEFFDPSVVARMKDLGTVFVRYPSGIADDVHWNGSGHFDTNGTWIADRDIYKPSFQGRMTHRGTTSHYGRPSVVTDGNTNTFWLSYADPAAPRAQWLYVDLGEIQKSDAVTIAWGEPHATRFTIQYWKPDAMNQWSPYSADQDDWAPTSAASQAGTGGVQHVEFTPVSTRYLRVFMTDSSATPPRYAIAELEAWFNTNRLTLHDSKVNLDPSDALWKPRQSWTVASSTDPATTFEVGYSFDFESYMSWIRTLSPQAVPLITINCGGATPEEAAAWVHYANRVKGYGIRYWEIGNEMNGSWESGGPLGAREYARRYLAFYDAMKAEDPGIVIAGPGASDFAAASNDYDGQPFVQSFIDTLADLKRAGCAEMIDAHWYPFFMNNNRQATWETVRQLAEAPSKMKRWLKRHPAADTVPIMNTEYNSGAGTPFSTSIENGLWLADTLGTFIRGFGSRGFASYWTVLHPADAASNPVGGDQSLFQLETNAWHLQSRGVYHALKLASADWAIPGDTNVHQLVKTTSNQPWLTAYADLRPDKLLSLMVVNRGETAAAGTLRLEHFTSASARCWTLDDSKYAWTTNAPPYHADPDSMPTPVVLTRSVSPMQHVFPPRSLTVFQFTPR
ncbi:MAG: discoidin domain-containing protein [Verrucomicrobiota bacterium]